MKTESQRRPTLRAPRPHQDARAPTHDERVLLHGVSWEQYRAISDALGDGVHARLTYLEGVLEIMSPGDAHERKKSRIGALVELYALERGIELEAYGQTTFRKRTQERGLEPDECYVFGRSLRGRKRPDLAIEVEETRPALRKLEVYRGLAVPEVWLWRGGRLSVHALVGETYETREASAFLPGLDLALVASLVRSSRSLTAVLRALRARVRGEE